VQHGISAAGTGRNCQAAPYTPIPHELIPIACCSLECEGLLTFCLNPSIIVSRVVGGCSSPHFSCHRLGLGSWDCTGQVRGSGWAWCAHRSCASIQPELSGPNSLASSVPESLYAGPQPYGEACVRGEVTAMIWEVAHGKGGHTQARVTPMPAVHICVHSIGTLAFRLMLANSSPHPPPPPYWRSGVCKISSQTSPSSQPSSR
jgi:hypothetical protein